MDNSQPPKYQHLVLYTQFGKTHYTIGDVVTNARDDATEGRSLSFFFSMNLASHVAQTALRRRGVGTDGRWTALLQVQGHSVALRQCGGAFV